MTKSNAKKSNKKLNVKPSVQTKNTYGEKPIILSRRTRVCHTFWRNKSTWLSIITVGIAAWALCISHNVARVQVNQYQTLKSYAELEEVDMEVTLLNKRLVDLKQHFNETPTALTLTDQASIIREIALFIRNAESARTRRDTVDATLSLIQANEIIDRHLPSKAPIKPGQVSVTSTPGYISVYFDFPEAITVTNTLGEPVTTITAVANSAPDYAYREYFNVLAVEVGPTGTVFSQPVKMTFPYLTENIPQDSKEEDLIIGIWDNMSKRWEILTSHVDLESHSIITSSKYLGVFSILAPRPTP